MQESAKPEPTSPSKESARAPADDETTPPLEKYQRRKHYGSTPTKADRKAIGAGPDDVADHNPPLVQRYWDGDPATGEKPGRLMTKNERRVSANDRTRMKIQPKSESNMQGAEMSKFSKEKNKENGL
jgi:hypothetical protein